MRKGSKDKMYSAMMSKETSMPKAKDVKSIAKMPKMGKRKT